MEALRPQDVNLAANMDAEALDGLARKVIEAYKEDDSSRAEWLDQRAHWIELYYQKDKPKERPWDGSSEESIPLLAEGCNQFHARAFPALFPNNRVFQAIPVGEIKDGDEERAARITKHLNWQLFVRDRRYKKDKDALLSGLALHGSVFTKTYYDPIKQRPVVKNIRAEDFVVPYGVGPRSIEECARTTEIVWCSKAETEQLAAVGFYTQPAEPMVMGETAPTTQAQDNVSGIHDPGPSKGNATPCKLLVHDCFYDLDEDGQPEPYTITVCEQSKKVLRLTARYTMDPRSGLRLPTNCYTHYVYMPNPDGFYGLGLGHLLSSPNTSVNKLLRMFTDAGELATIGNMSGFVSDQLDLPGKEIEFQLGQFRKVRNTTNDLKASIYQMQFPGPARPIYEVMSLLLARGDRLGTVTEALTGQTESVMQPTTVMALIEQGLTQFSTVFARVIDAINDEVAKIAELNAAYLSPIEYFTVLDLDGRYVKGEIARSDYTSDMQVTIVADPKMATEQQKLAKAQAEYQWGMTNPLVMQNPIAFYNLSRRYLEALGSRNIGEILPPPMPPMDPNAQRVDDPNLENMIFLMPGAPPPMPFMDQNHMLHIQAHEMLLKDPQYGMRIPPDRRGALEAHVQMHLAMVYGMTESQMMMEMGLGSQDAGAGPEAGNVAPMVSAGGNLMAPPSPPVAMGPGVEGASGINGQPPNGAGAGPGNGAPGNPGDDRQQGMMP